MKLHQLKNNGVFEKKEVKQLSNATDTEYEERDKAVGYNQAKAELSEAELRKGE